MNCGFCGAKNIGYDHHCPRDFTGMSEKDIRKMYGKRWSTNRFLIWAIIVVGVVTSVFMYWRVL